MGREVENVVMLVFLTGCMMVAFENRLALAESFRWHSSPIDWCEENYAVHEMVVEFWNSLSSVVLFLMAFIAPQFFDNELREHEPGVVMLWALMAMVGIGSILFHGTLSIAGQVLDELPISLLAMFGCFMLVPPKQWNPTIRRLVFAPRFFLMTVVSSSIGCILYPVFSHIFCLLWIPLTISAFIWQYRSAERKAKQAAWGMFSITLGTFGLAFGSWLIDKFLCHQVANIIGFSPQLHAWWHVFVSLTFWGCVGTGVILRSYADGKKVKLINSGFLMPHVALEKV